MMWFVAYVMTGAVVGVFAGLLGIGGGMTLVPVLAAVFASQHLAPDHVVHMALATSMASIIFTSGASVREHWKLGGVDFSIVKRMAPGMVVGSLLATVASAWIAQRTLALSFAIIVYLGATQILLNRKPAAARTLPGPIPLLAVGTCIGVVCGLVSAGGAFLTIPFMLWCGVPLRTTIGTAAMIGIPVAVVGTIGYLISGWHVPNLPPDALGFISVSALFGLVCGSVVTAPYGARLAHRLPVATIKRVFAVLLYALATKMLVTYI
ncbi:MAG: sulfite exporter TauE/SafE family protein [Herminiimonas sp.]|nr:sulfite exporter TauE/SafE family protein [Herminiimonas sp.]